MSPSIKVNFASTLLCPNLMYACNVFTIILVVTFISVIININNPIACLLGGRDCNRKS